MRHQPSAPTQSAHRPTRVMGVLILVLAGAHCVSAPPTRPRVPASTTLRVGGSQMLLGRQFIENLTLEGLTKISSNGRVKMWLAEDVTTSADGLLITVTTRPNVLFHDGSPVTTDIIASTLYETFAESSFTRGDIEAIVPVADSRIEIRLRHPSRFVSESLEESIRKPGAREIGTGPFAAVDSEAEAAVRANPHYYLGQPALDRIVVSMYPTVRSAWAEILRDNLDMVYEVGVNALDSLELSDRIRVFSYTRNYQYVIFFNINTPALRSPDVRRALNAAVDRSAFIRDALNGNGLESTGPVWPRNWAVEGDLKPLPFDPSNAAKILNP